MSGKLSEYIRVSYGTKNVNYIMTDDAIFCINGRTHFRVSKERSFIYYVVGGGANGSPGSSTSTVGRGGGGGAVQTGRVTLKPNIAYIMHVKPKQSDGNAQNTVFSSEDKSIDITANGGRVIASGNYGNSGNGARTTGGEDVKLHRDASSPASGPGYGNGGMSAAVGGTAGKAGTSTNINGGDGISLGSGGGGGYGSNGRGGIGKDGVIILIDMDHSNIVQDVEKQLREMNQLPGTMLDQYKQQYNASMMAGALWTVLATSLVFYVFTKV